MGQYRTGKRKKKRPADKPKIWRDYTLIKTETPGRYRAVWLQRGKYTRFPARLFCSKPLTKLNISAAQRSALQRGMASGVEQGYKVREATLGRAAKHD